jgi:hypothetical protein
MPGLGQGFRVQLSRRPEKFTRRRRAAGLIEKETLKKRMSNNEYRMSKEGILPVVSFCVERSIL